MAADDLPSYQFAAVKQRTSPELRKQIQYELILRQQPKQSRMCGVGEKADRRPIDPPPIVELIVRAPGPKGEYTPYLQNPYYFMHASLVEKDTKEEVHLIKDNKTKATTGSSVSSLYPLKDTDGSSAESGFFVFPDLSVRMEGTYRLKFCLYEMVGREVYFCSSVISAPLTVYSAKKFPGMEESTALSQSFAEQGLKIRIRKEIRPKKKRRGIHPSAPPSLAMKEDDFQHDSDDEEHEQTPPLAMDSQKTKRRHKSLEGKTDSAKKPLQVPKRITYPSTPSQSSAMEVDSSASSVASHPDSSTLATETTRRSSNSSVGHPFPELRLTEAEVDIHHSSPGIAKRVSSDAHGSANYSMPPPGQPPSNYHFAEYPSHRSSQSHSFAAAQHHSGVDSRAPLASTHAMSYSYYSAPRTNSTEAPQTTHESRRRSGSSHIVPPPFDSRPEPYPPEYGPGHTAPYRSSESAILAPHDQDKDRQGSADQRHHLVSQHLTRAEPGHDDTPSAYGRPYPTHPAGNPPPARSPHDHPEMTGSVENRPQHYPHQHINQPPSRHYGYPPSKAPAQEAVYGQTPVHHHHHHHHYHVVNPYDAPRLPASYTEVIVNGPARPPYSASYGGDSILARAPSFGSQETLPGMALGGSPSGSRGGHETMALVPAGHTKPGLSPADERANSPSDYFGRRPSNGREGAHRHSGYHYQYGTEGTPPIDSSVPPHHRRALSASAASGPAEPSVSLSREIAAPSGDRSSRPGPLPHRHSSQGISGVPQHYPPTTVASPPVHPLSNPKSGPNNQPVVEFGHPSLAGPVPGRSNANVPPPHGNDTNYPSPSWVHSGYKPSINGEWTRSGQPHLGTPSPSSTSSSHLPASSMAHTSATVAPSEHLSAYGYPTDRRGVGHSHQAVYQSGHSSNTSRPSHLSTPVPKVSQSMSRQSHPPPPPPPRGYDSSYTSSPRFPMSDPPGHPAPAPVSSWYESSHNHHAGTNPVPAVGNGGGPPVGEGHPSVLEMRDSRPPGPHGLGPASGARPMESCVDMPRSYSSRHNS